LKVILKVSPDDQELLSTQDPSTFSLKSLVNFSWDIAVDGTELTAEEVKSIVEGGQSVFYKDGRWISVDVSSFKTKLEEIKSLIPQRKLSLFEALRLGLGGVDSSNPLEILRIDAEGWIREILNFSDTSKVEERLPDSFKGQLRPYQLVGLSWLNLISKIHIGGCLADDMGLGKTVQVLALLALEFEDKKLEQLEQGKKSLSPNLLVVPMSILGNWEAEAKKFVPELKVYVHHGNTRESGTSFSDTILSCDLIITTYSLLYRDYRLFRKHSWHRVILDEAQNIKNIDAKQTKAVRALLEDYSYKNLGDNRFDVLPRRLALTGTPLENRLIELWSILDFLNPGLLGGIEDFKRRFVNQIEKNRDSEQAKKLSNLIKPFILRRTKLDPEIVADLPEKIEIESIVHLTPEQAKLYRDTLDEMLPRVKSAEGLHRKGIVLSTITRLKQICVHPELVLGTGGDLLGRSGKLEFLEEILETVLAEGDRVLIFSQFAKWGSLLSPYLAKKLSTPIPFFHGGLARHDREKIIKEFQEPNGPPILMLSLKAGGFGLNLTAANQVVHLDQWWNPAVQAQATDRAYRIGQKSNVQVRTVISKGTPEEKINEMHKKKIELTNSIVETTKNSITELSTEALEELLTLQS
jgi:SNF2 family DNA or RNA helicase